MSVSSRRSRSSKAESQTGRRCEDEATRPQLDPLVRPSKKRQMGTEITVAISGSRQAAMEAPDSAFNSVCGFQSFVDALNRQLQRKDDEVRGLETENMNLLAAQEAARAQVEELEACKTRDAKRLRELSEMFRKLRHAAEAAEESALSAENDKLALLAERDAARLHIQELESLLGKTPRVQELEAFTTRTEKHAQEMTVLRHAAEEARAATKSLQAQLEANAAESAREISELEQSAKEARNAAEDEKMRLLADLDARDLQIQVLESRTTSTEKASEETSAKLVAADSKAAPFATQTVSSMPSTLAQSSSRHVQKFDEMFACFTTEAKGRCVFLRHESQIIPKELLGGGPFFSEQPLVYIRRSQARGLHNYIEKLGEAGRFTSNLENLHAGLVCILPSGELVLKDLLRVKKRLCTKV